MSDLVTRLRERIDTLTDQRDQARAERDQARAERDAASRRGRRQQLRAQLWRRRFQELSRSRLPDLSHELAVTKRRVDYWRRVANGGRR